MKKKTTFEVGDRVAITKRHCDFNERMYVGLLGTVVYADSYGIGIRWDENIGGHRLRSEGIFHCEEGHGWWLYPDVYCCIEVINDVDVSVDVDNFV